MQDTLKRARLRSGEKNSRDRMLAAVAVKSLAELAYRNPESKVYDAIVGTKDLAAWIETWFTAGIGARGLR